MLINLINDQFAYHNYFYNTIDVYINRFNNNFQQVYILFILKLYKLVEEYFRSLTDYIKILSKWARFNC